MHGNKCISVLTRYCVGLGLVLVFIPSLHAWGGQDIDAQIKELQEQLVTMGEMIKATQGKLDELIKENEKKTHQIVEMGKRLDDTELHTATDRISLGVELRTRGDSLDYHDMLFAPESFTSGFFIPYNPGNPAKGGFNGATLAEARQLMAAMQAAGMVPIPQKADIRNDVIFTNKFRLNLKANVNPNLSFAGRLAAYKVFGDSSTVKYNPGNVTDGTYDGNTASLPHDDIIHLERAYFVYKRDFFDLPMAFSLGRRPATDGPPMEYRNFGLEGGSPLATIINWQFDGASLSFDLDEATEIPGAEIKFCYGVGFEGEWGNTYSLNSTKPNVDDVHLFGIIATLYNDGLSSLVVNWAHGFDITDGFIGQTVMPFIVSKNANGQYSFEPNYGNFISRLEPMTNIGDWDGLTVLLRTDLEEQVGRKIDLYLAGSWSHTNPSHVSRTPFFELMGAGFLSSNNDLAPRDGYSILAGVNFPMPFDARLGFEYNWGSKYWFNFTWAEDSLVGTKMAARGQVFDVFYHQPIFGNNFFLSVGAQYYDYKYTGSGNPLGAPVKISEATALDTLTPIIDDVMVYYGALELRL